jgi:hypothetical protein
VNRMKKEIGIGSLKRSSYEGLAITVVVAEMLCYGLSFGCIVARYWALWGYLHWNGGI